MLSLIHLSEAFRLYLRSLRARIKGIRKYEGNSVDICRKILEDCYNKEKGYFQVSNGHFCEFYSRDFGWICKALIDLGHKDKVRNTLDYALGVFQKHGRITTTISPNGKAFDFPYYAVDSFAYMLNSLVLLNDKGLINKYKVFLKKEIEYFVKAVVDESTGLVRKDCYFSSMKDHSKRKSSCYDNCMLYLCQKACKRMGLRSVLDKYDYKRLIIKNFWTGEYFLDDLSGKKGVAGDANVFPFWTGIVDDKVMLRKVVGSVVMEGLDKLFPLKYTNKSNKEVSLNFVLSLFAAGYERDMIWTHMGILYIDILGKVDGKLQKEHLIKYRDMILKHGNYLEVFDPNGRVYSTLFYLSDEGMSWCANYLVLAEKLGIEL